MDFIYSLLKSDGIIYQYTYTICIHNFFCYYYKLYDEFYKVLFLLLCSLYSTLKAKEGTGMVRQKLIAREKIDDVLAFIKENCDMTSNTSGDRIIYSTGLGGNKFKTKIEEELGVK